MATYYGGSVKPRVRFPSPAPIFFVFLFFSLSISAGAVSVNENQIYGFSEFNSLDTDSAAVTSFRGAALHSPSSPYYSVSAAKSYLIPASGNNTDSVSTSSIPVSYFSYFSPSWRFVKVGFSCDRDPNVIGVSLLSVPTVKVWVAAGSDTSSHYIDFNPVVSSGNVELRHTTNGYGAVYATSIDIQQSFVNFDVYIAIPDSYFLCGFSVNQNRPSDISSSTSWRFPSDRFSFVVSTSKIIPPSSGGSGSADLTPVLNDIQALSNQMSSEFLAVNNRISQAETSITTSISDQTSALQSSIAGQTASLESSIADGADTVVDGVNDHFDDWDDELQNAYSSEAAGVITDTNQAVDDMHQFEEDRIDDADQALGDVGLESYQVPSEVSASFVEIGTLFRLLFNSFPFVSSLIVFSCTFGIAFVLIGRKSRGS